MIFPEECKVVGYARGRPCGERVYFLTKYLIRPCEGGHEVLSIETEEGTGLMRTLRSTGVLAAAGEVCLYPAPVCIHDRYRLVRLAAESGKRCTIFRGEDEHITFVLDPDPEQFLAVHVYDVSPPAPSLSGAIKSLEACGAFGELGVRFEHHIRDISDTGAEVFPCRAAGFPVTLDSDPMHGGERIAGCRTGAELYRECYGDEFSLENICPLEAVQEEPFIARCCRSEQEGVREIGGRLGAVVHWAAPPGKIVNAVRELRRRFGEG